MASHLVIAFVGSVVVHAAGRFGVGFVYGIIADDSGQPPRMLGSAPRVHPGAVAVRRARLGAVRHGCAGGRRGVNLAPLAVLTIIAAGLTCVGLVVAFRRRDIGQV
ncbi:MAG TPA: hypothetical protein VIW24_08690 [Aldersonia sp.]